MGSTLTNDIQLPTIGAGGGRSVIENNGGYISVTTPISTLTGKRNMVVIQTDFDGNVIFEKVYGDTTYSYYIGFQGSLQKVTTGGYIMYGTKQDTGSYDLLYRFNDVGDTLWTRQIADTIYGNIGYQVKQTLDGGFICIGERGVSFAPISIIKTDSLGNKQWEQFYGGTTYDKPTSIAVCSDGGYIYTSATRSGGVGLPKDNIRIMKVDSLGNIVFNKFFGGVYDDNAWSILQTQDGGYLFGGNFTFLDTSCNCQKANPYVIKLDSLGDTLWTRKYGEAMSNATVLNMYELTDGNIILCGLTRKEQITGGDYQIQGLVFKIAANGDSLFYRLYRLLSSSSSHELRDIRPTSDGGFICSGIIYPAFPDTGTQDMWLLKLDSLGCADTACALGTGIPPLPSQREGVGRIYPNPANSFVTVELQNLSSTSIFSLLDVTGKEVVRKPITSFYTQINVQALPKGIYFYVVTNEKERYSGKLIKN
jgi:hypothetical protein